MTEIDLSEIKIEKGESTNTIQLSDDNWYYNEVSNCKRFD